MAETLYYHPGSQTISPDTLRWADTYLSDQPSEQSWTFLLSQAFSSKDGEALLEQVLVNQKIEISSSDLDMLKTLAQGLQSHAQFLSESSVNREKVVGVRKLFGPLIYPAAFEMVMNFAKDEITAKEIERSVAEHLQEKLALLVIILEEIEKEWAKQVGLLNIQERSWEETEKLAYASSRTQNHQDLAVFVQDSETVIKEEKQYVKAKGTFTRSILGGLRSMRLWLNQCAESVAALASQPVGLNYLGKATVSAAV